jgi:hypothetical protein
MVLLSQIFGIFPAKVSSDYMNFELNPKMLLLTFSVKVIFVSLIVALMFACLRDQESLEFLKVES